MNLNNRECNNSDQKQIVLKQSDFSIEHILTRAGEDNNPKICYNEFTNNFFQKQTLCKTIIEKQLSDRQCVVPMFNWLQYTRYRPPKLPSKNNCI